MNYTLEDIKKQSPYPIGELNTAYAKHLVRHAGFPSEYLQATLPNYILPFRHHSTAQRYRTYFVFPTLHGSNDATRFFS